MHFMRPDWIFPYGFIVFLVTIGAGGLFYARRKDGVGWGEWKRPRAWGVFFFSLLACTAVLEYPLIFYGSPTGVVSGTVKRANK